MVEKQKDNKVNKYALGAIVKSVQGRDKDNLFVIIAKADDNDFVFIADGKYRKIQNPKKKRLKHVKVLGWLDNISTKLVENKKIFDSELNSAITKFYNANL